MMRSILFFVLALIGFYIIKRFLAAVIGPNRRGQFKKNRGAGGSRKPPPITDELVKDPVCGVYCPKMESLTLTVKGTIHYFCSKECLNTFRRQQKK